MLLVMVVFSSKARTGYLPGFFLVLPLAVGVSPTRALSRVLHDGFLLSCLSRFSSFWIFVFRVFRFTWFRGVSGPTRCCSLGRRTAAAIAEALGVVSRYFFPVFSRKISAV